MGSTSFIQSVCIKKIILGTMDKNVISIHITACKDKTSLHIYLNATINRYYI